MHAHTHTYISRTTIINNNCNMSTDITCYKYTHYNK